MGWHWVAWLNNEWKNDNVIILTMLLYIKMLYNNSNSIWFYCYHVQYCMCTRSSMTICHFVKAMYTLSALCLPRCLFLVGCPSLSADPRLYTCRRLFSVGLRLSSILLTVNCLQDQDFTKDRNRYYWLFKFKNIALKSDSFSPFTNFYSLMWYRKRISQDV